jgi:hypothetical protein
MVSITAFLTDKSKPIYQKVIHIVEKIELVLNCKVSIFGGFIRNIIEHYHKPSSEFKFNDVDIWIFFDNKLIQSKQSFRNLINNGAYKINSKAKYSGDALETGSASNYNSFKNDIEGIIFDFNCNYPNEPTLSYDFLTDFTVNNLSMEINGQLNMRIKVDYTIENIIEHIKQKLLIEIQTIDKLKQFKYFNKDNLTEKLKLRTEKMLSYGYIFKDKTIMTELEKEIDDLEEINTKDEIVIVL